MLVWISDLGMKKGFPEITGNPICGAKGTPAVCWSSAVFPVCRNVGYQLGYLTWLFSCFFSTLPHVHERTNSIYLSRECPPPTGATGIIGR